MPFRVKVVALLAAASLLAGCAGEPQVAPKEVVQYGVIESVTPIKLDDSSNVGTNVGGIFGQAGGASSGGGSGAAVGSIFGAVLGSTLGRQAGIATKPGLEIWVKLDESGKSTYVMQPGKPDAFKVGDPVRVIRKGKAARVEPSLLGAPPAAEPPKEQ
ncbi:MAG TPA: hypothetical protein VFW59_05175 [Gallionella sp.]|nr:hypothetical protein [Gallionella sp.]